MHWQHAHGLLILEEFNENSWDELRSFSALADANSWVILGCDGVTAVYILVRMAVVFNGPPRRPLSSTRSTMYSRASIRGWSQFVFNNDPFHLHIFHNEGVVWGCELSCWIIGWWIRSISRTDLAVVPDPCWLVACPWPKIDGACDLILSNNIYKPLVRWACHGTNQRLAWWTWANNVLVLMGIK